jgi:hypothetical protein
MLLPEKAVLINDEKMADIRGARSRGLLRSWASKGVQGWAQHWKEVRIGALESNQRIEAACWEIQKAAGPRWREKVMAEEAPLKEEEGMG